MKHSVIMPVRNGARHISEALASALPQLTADDEVVVIDNGSTDTTVELVRALRDPRIRIITETTVGPAAARNAGLQEATGELVSFLDHDDLWPEGRNEGLLAALAASTSAHAAYGRMRVQFDAGYEPSISSMDGALSNRIVLGVFIFRAASLRETGPFAATQLTGSDIDFLLRYEAAKWPAVAWEGDALVYRRHETNLTGNGPRKQAGLMQSLASHLARKRQQS